MESYILGYICFCFDEIVCVRLEDFRIFFYVFMSVINVCIY